ncbi:MAG: amidohydrolase family protein, partial [Candidatus Eremiobacteraeota bacterium]|nr:amidohydrolase family protein [Candidatus Eremiobacteraeota bacterium]
TLMLWKSYLRHDRRSTQLSAVETAINQLRAWREAGAGVLFGTDLGAVDCDPTDEYLMMVQAGMSFRDILASLTTEPSKRFSDPARFGKIGPGYEADLTVLRGDPSAEVTALTDVRYTFRAGRVIYSEKF